MTLKYTDSDLSAASDLPETGDAQMSDGAQDLVPVVARYMVENESLRRSLSAALAKGREEAMAICRGWIDQFGDGPDIQFTPARAYARDAIHDIMDNIRALSPSSPGEPLPPAADEIERVARAICAEYGDDYDEQPEDIAALRALRKGQGGDGEVYAHDPGLPTREDWRKMAAAGLAARRPSPGEPAGSGWQPIATAPRGEVVFVGKRGDVRRVTALRRADIWRHAESLTKVCFEPDVWCPLPAPPHEPTGEA